MKKLIKAYTKLCKAYKRACKSLEHYNANPYLENYRKAKKTYEAAKAAERVVIGLSAKVPNLECPDRRIL